MSSCLLRTVSVHQLSLLAAHRACTDAARSLQSIYMVSSHLPFSWGLAAAASLMHWTFPGTMGSSVLPEVLFSLHQLNKRQNPLGLCEGLRAD